VQGLKSSMELIAKLRPVTYNFKPDDYAEYYDFLRESGVLDSVVINNDDDLRKYFSLGEPRDVERKHIGFLAQELREIFPELVYEDNKGSLSIDYISLIPVLVGTIQELNKTTQEQGKSIQEMTEVIQSLSSRLNALENNTGSIQGSPKILSFSLFPNPTNDGFVTVDYTMYVDAPITIELYNVMGQKIKMILPKQNQRAGNYSVQTSVANLISGTYIVKATSENQIESKQLVINN